MVQQVLQRFGFTYSSPQSTPLPTGHSLSALPSDESVESSGPYPELVGCLMYLMTCTRPDLAYPLTILARYVAPGRHRKEHMDAAKRVLRYLCSTSGMGLVLGGRERPVLTGHSDASWADDQATQRSSQGYTFSLGSGSVSWRSTRSSSVLSSSCEAEIYATAMASQELRWLTYLLTDLGERPRSPPVLYVDNKATIALCQEHRLEHRTKHIALRYFLARELQQRGQLRLSFVATEANTADVFTKALPPQSSEVKLQPHANLQLTRSPAGAATALAAAAAALAAAATAPAAAASALLLQLQPLLLQLQPLLLPLQFLLTSLQPCCCRYCPCCCRYSPAAAATAPAAAATALAAAATVPAVVATALLLLLQPCCCCYSPCYCSYSPCCCRYSPAATATALAAAATSLAAAATALDAAATTLLLLLQPCCCCYRPCCCRYSPCCCRYSHTTAATALAAVATTTRCCYSCHYRPCATAVDCRCRSWPFSQYLWLFTINSVSLLEHTSGSLQAPTTPTEPAADAGDAVQWRYQVDSLAYTQWTERDAVAQCVIRAHLPNDQSDHFRQVTSAQSLYDAIVRHYSSLNPATRPLHQRRPLLGKLQQLVEEVSVGACASACTGGAASGGGGSEGGQQRQQKAASLGACESASIGAASVEAFLTFTLDSGASCCFFRDCTIVTPLTTPVLVSLSDPSFGPVVARGTTVLPCPAVPSGSLTGFHLPSFAMDLVSQAVLQDRLVTTTTPGGELVAICSCVELVSVAHAPIPPRAPPSWSPFPAVSASHALASPYLGPSEVPAPAPSVACAAGPAPVPGPGRERYFLLVVNDYTCNTMVFPLRSKSGVRSVLIPWIRTVRRQLRARFRQNLPVFRLHSDRGDEYSSGLLEDFCREEGITQSFTLSASPQQKGIVERRIGLVMEVARTSMIHAASPHFLWPFAVRYAAHQLNLWPHVSKPEALPTLRWTGKVGDVSAFRVWGSFSHVCDTTADKLSSRTIRCVFLGFPTDAPVWQFYNPAMHRVLSSHDVTFDESVCYYRLLPHVSSPVPPPPLFLVPGYPPVDPHPLSRLAPSGVSQVTPLPLVEPLEVSSGPAEGGDPVADDTAASCHSPRLETPPGFPPRPSSPPLQPVAVDSSAAGGGGAGGVGSEGAHAGSAEPGGAELGGAEPGGVASGGGQQLPSRLQETLSPQQLREWVVRYRADTGGTRYGGTELGNADSGGAECGGGQPLPLRRQETLSPQQLREWVVGRHAESAGAGSGGAEREGAAPGGTEPAVSDSRARGVDASGAGGTGARGAEGFETRGVGAGGTVTGGAGRTRAGSTGGLGARGAAQPVQRRPFFWPHPESSLPPPGLVLRQCVALPSPPASSLPDVPDSESDVVCATSPTVTHVLATLVTDPTFESAAAFALVTELVDFAAACRLNYVASLVTKSESDCPPSVGGECALSMDVLEDRQFELECLTAAVPHLAAMLLAPKRDPDALDIPTPRSYVEAITGPYSSQWQTAMDAEMASWKSTGTYVDAVPPPGANIDDGMWIFRVKRPPGSPPIFKACYVARGFCQRQGVDFFQTFSPTPKMTTLWVLLHVAAQRDYELHSLDFSTAFLQGSLHEEIWLCHPPSFIGSFPEGSQSSLQRPVYSLCQAPREWHDTLRTTLAALGFAPSTADLSLFLCTDPSLPPFYILVYVDDLVFATANTKALVLLKAELQKRHTCIDLGELRSYRGLQIIRDRARRTITLTQSHMVQQVLQRFGFWFSSPRAIRSQLHLRTNS
ncbi:unnamed protein product [Closterium sp. NIES-54]